MSEGRLPAQTQRGKVSERVSERCVHGEAEGRLEKMGAQGSMPSVKPGGLPRGLSNPRFGQPNLTLRGQEAPSSPPKTALNPLIPPWHWKERQGWVQREEDYRLWGEELPLSS